MSPNQQHHGSGDNTRDKFVYNFYGVGKVEIPRYLTNIPRPADKVIGRDAQLKLIHKRLAEDNSVILVNGLGGIGKTTIALEYIHRYGGDYQHLAWIEVTDSIRSAFISHPLLVRNLGLTDEVNQHLANQQEDQAFAVIINTLNRLERCLLVVDNANDRDDLRDCRHVLHTLRATTLLTSRAQPEEWNIVPIDELSPPDAYLLFTTHYHESIEADQVPLAQQLLQRLDHHTLLIELIAKAATKARLPLAELYDKVQTHYLHDADLNARTVSTGAHADHTKLPQQERVENYIRMVFQEISHLDATEQRYLRYCCLLPPNFYTEDFLLEVFQIDADTKTECLDTLESLNQKGWLPQKRDERGYTYQLHSLVQDVTVEKLGLEDTLHIVRWFGEKMDYNNLDNTHKLVEKNYWREYGDYLEKRFRDIKHKDVSYLLDRLAYLYENYGQYKTAAKLGECALEMDLYLYDENHPTVAVRQSNLANVYSDLGQYERARDLLEKALANDINNFGENHPTVAYCLNNLAWVEMDLENWQEAKSLFERAYQIFYAWLGAEHPNTKTVAENLAQAQAQLGE